MKKILSIILTVIIIACAVPVCSCAEAKDEKIVIELRSDIAGMTYRDYEKFAIIRSDNIRFDLSEDPDPAFVTNCVGSIIFDEMKPGRKYVICYTFYAADGFEIPDEMNEDTIEIICSENVNPYWYGKTVGPLRDGQPLYSLTMHTEVRVDGNFFQNLFGRIADLILRIKAWSPY